MTATLMLPSPVATADTRRLLPPHQSDPALLAILSLGSERFEGPIKRFDVEIVAQNQDAAQSLARDARRAQASGDITQAIEYLTRAIFLDQAGALNRTWLIRRAALSEKVGDMRPSRAMELYQIGCTLRQLRLWRDAEQAYDAAAVLDRDFLWPANNTAWMLATAPAGEAHNGAKAILAAEWACGRSGYGYWSFLGTLAAAFARDGDFERAADWQRISLRVTPKNHLHSAQLELQSFLRQEPWVARESAPAAGAQNHDDELRHIDVLKLLARAAELRESIKTLVH